MFKRLDKESRKSGRLVKPTFADERRKLASFKEGFAHLNENIIGESLKDIAELVFPEARVFEEGIDFLSGVNERINALGGDEEHRGVLWRTHHSTHKPWENKTWPNMGDSQAAAPGSVAIHHSGTTQYQHNAQQHAAVD